MKSFIELRQKLETASSVLEKFKQVGEFSISVSDFASKIAPAFGWEAEAKELLKVMGPEAELFKFRKRDKGSSVVPVAICPSVFGGKDSAVLLDAGLEPIKCEFKKHQVGPGGLAEVSIGAKQFTVSMVCSEELRNSVLMARDDGQDCNYSTVDGAPPLEVEDPNEVGSMISTLRAVPQRDLPPWADEIPHGEDLTVVEVLEPSRKYGSPRISVMTSGGVKIRGMIASKPIVQCLAPGGELNDDVLGKTFQIVDVETRYRRDGEAVPSEGGGSQKQVIVRAADAPSFSL